MHPNGTVYIMDHTSSYGYKHGEAILRADTWRGPYRMVASDTFDPISRGVEVPFKCLVDGVKLSLAKEGANLEQVSFDLFVEHIRKSAEVGANEDARRLLPLVHEIRRRGRPRAYEAATRQTRFEAANSCSALVTEPGRIAQQSQITPKTIQKCIAFCLLSEKIKDGP